MQGTTRSVDAGEGVAATEAMADSSSAGDKSSSVVVSNGGGGRFKRKGMSGGHSTVSRTIMKKKLCSSSSTSEVAEPAENSAVKSSSGGLVTMKKKKERVDDEIVGDPSLEDAALALTEFSFFARNPVRSPLGPKPSLPSALPQWSIKKLRSGRIKRLESPSNEDSHDAIATDSSGPPPLLLQKQLCSECSSSPCGDSQSVITLVKVEDDPLCSSTRVEEAEQVEQHGVVVVVEEQEEKNNSRSPSVSERLPKLTSVSSIESLMPDSRADSPISPLPALLLNGEFASIVPKLEGNPAGRSAFQRVVPIRPVKKSTLCRKRKVEEKTFEDLNPEQAAVKHVSRKKPRPTGFVPQPQNQQQQQQQQLTLVKIEESDAFCALALALPRPSAAEEEQVKKVDAASGIALAAVVVEDTVVRLDPVIKLEAKVSGKLGQRAASKPKPALSESEREARKQRRVQANRESARLTIRKKQLLCEELSKKSQLLSSENEAFRKEVERMRLKCKSISEMNAKLRDQVGKATGDYEPGSSSPAPASVEKAPDAMVQYQFPPQFGGPPIPPQYWAVAMMAQAQAQSAQAGVQPCEMNMGSAEYTQVIFQAAAAAVAVAYGNNPQAGFWNMASSSNQGQSSMLPPFYPGHLPGAAVASTLPSSSVTPASISPITRTVSLPVGPTDTSFSQVGSERFLPSGKPMVSYRSGDFADAVHHSNDLKRNGMKQDWAHQGSGFNGRTHYYQMTPGSQTGMSATGVGSMATRKSGEGNCLPMSNTSAQHLSCSHSLSTVPKLHSRYPMFGSGGMLMTQEQPTARESEAQRAAALATEARRKRIEMKRTKSILSRQGSRVAEPSAS